MDITVSTHGDRAVKLTVTHGPMLQSILLDAADWPTVRSLLQQAVDALGVEDVAPHDQPARPRNTRARTGQAGKMPSRAKRTA